jgi:hypothetical protein
MKGLQFDGLEIPSAEPTIERIQLANPEGTELQIAISFSAVGSQDEARTIAARVIEPILNRLAFQENIAIGFPRPLTSSFIEIQTDGPLDHNLSLVAHVYVQDYFTAIRVLHPNAAAQLQADLVRPAPAGEPHYSAFRQALNAEDFVDRFMSLFRILLDLRRTPDGRESQEVVDNFIHTEFGEALVAPSHRPNAPETVYTRLRNEVGHARPGVLPETTRQEISTHLADLAKIVRRAIELS